MTEKTNIKLVFEKLVRVFFKHQIQLKMFHFQTKKYGAHKASDTYLEEFANNFDKFMEVAQGAFGKLETQNMTFSFNMIDDNTIFEELDNFINLLRQLDAYLIRNSDLLNIRDEMIGNAQQLKYLLTFQ